jgi:hypothetical protein
MKTDADIRRAKEEKKRKEREEKARNKILTKKIK